MNFVLFELAQDMLVALKLSAQVMDMNGAGTDAQWAAVTDAIAKAEAAGVTARLPATTTE
jgi:hypothetical protein